MTIPDGNHLLLDFKCFKVRLYKVFDMINFIGGRFRNRHKIFHGKGVLLSLLWAEVSDLFR